MGFKVKRKTYKLVWQEGHDLEGLEVMVRSLDTGQFLKLTGARADRDAGGEQEENGTRRMLDMLAANLVSWNAEDEDGQPIPATIDGILAQDVAFNVAVIDAWTEAINGVPAPLSQTSSDGQPSLEASIPMETPSESLAS
ncbi:hypothetical protein [Peterkaempfera sp. SMS 1(5)a]|uniref:hypothetical protein n=1 Tax=Peterkaempfera podocarpi TaxID=3232308 RepID=UPI003670631E